MLYRTRWAVVAGLALVAFAVTRQEVPVSGTLAGVQGEVVAGRDETHLLAAPADLFKVYVAPVSAAVGLDHLSIGSRLTVSAGAAKPVMYQVTAIEPEPAAAKAGGDLSFVTCRVPVPAGTCVERVRVSAIIVPDVAAPRQTRL